MHKSLFCFNLININLIQVSALLPCTAGAGRDFQHAIHKSPSAMNACPTVRPVGCKFIHHWTGQLNPLQWTQCSAALYALAQVHWYDFYSKLTPISRKKKKENSNLSLTCSDWRKPCLDPGEKFFLKGCSYWLYIFVWIECCSETKTKLEPVFAYIICTASVNNCNKVNNISHTIPSTQKIWKCINLVYNKLTCSKSDKWWQLMHLGNINCERCDQ